MFFFGQQKEHNPRGITSENTLLGTRANLPHYQDFNYGKIVRNKLWQIMIIVNNGKILKINKLW